MLWVSFRVAPQSRQESSGLRMMLRGKHGGGTAAPCAHRCVLHAPRVLSSEVHSASGSRGGGAWLRGIVAVRGFEELVGAG
eukprot:5029384-Prymnesium_polylepis.1